RERTRAGTSRRRRGNVSKRRIEVLMPDSAECRANTAFVQLRCGGEQRLQPTDQKATLASARGSRRAWIARSWDEYRSKSSPARIAKLGMRVSSALRAALA